MDVVILVLVETFATLDNCFQGLVDGGRLLIDWFSKLYVQTFQPLIVYTGGVIFVFHHWGCMSIYRPLSYPFRSLAERDSKHVSNHKNTQRFYLFQLFHML